MPFNNTNSGRETIALTHPVGRVDRPAQLSRRVVRRHAARPVTKQVLTVLEAHARRSQAPTNVCFRSWTRTVGNLYLTQEKQRAPLTRCQTLYLPTQPLDGATQSRGLR